MLKCFLGWTWIRRERLDKLFRVLALWVNTLNLNVPSSLCWSHMIEAFLQNKVILTDLPMISPSESDLTSSVWSVLSCTSRRSMRFFTNMISHCIYGWVLVYLLHNVCVMIIATCYVMVGNELCECEMLCCTWDVLCAWIGHASEKLWPFEFLESFRC